MTQDPNGWTISIRPGERLEFGLSISLVSGVSLPLIVRRHITSSGDQKIQTEQHVLIQSIEKLDAWFFVDPFIAECETSFKQIRGVCMTILNRGDDE
jgi:hypothetical protein